MRWLYRHVIRPVLFTQNPEEIHDRTMRALGVVSRHRALCGMMRACFGSADLPVDRVDRLTVRLGNTAAKIAGEHTALLARLP